MSYKITNESGETAVISDEQYNRIKDRLNASTKVERVTEKSMLRPHQERQKKYGTLGSMFPYLADDYDRNGPVNSLGGAARRATAGIKDVASYPGRAVSGMMDFLVNGDNSLGKTSEEAISQGQTVGGIARNAFTPMFFPTSGVGMVESILGGAALNAADALSGQEGYEQDPYLAAALGGAAGLLGSAAPSAIKGIIAKIRRGDKVTQEEFEALANAAMRGPLSKELNSLETQQLINSQPEVIDQIARNANYGSLKNMETEAARSLENFGMTPIAQDSRKANVGMNRYRSRGDMSHTMSPKEEAIADELSEKQGLLDIAKKDKGAPKAILKESKEEVAKLKSDLKAAKSERWKNYSGGVNQLEQNGTKLSQKAVTDKTTSKFFDDLNMLLDDAATRMSSQWRTEGGRLRRNARGQVIPATPEQIGKRANDYVNMLSDQVQARARANARGIGDKAPRITNEDISVVLRKMAQNNEFEFMDALLNAATWIDVGTKQALKSAAIVEKAANNAKSFMGTNLKYLDGEGNVVKNIAMNTPAGKAVKNLYNAAFPKQGGFPRDFSKRYEAMMDGTKTRQALDVLSRGNPPRLLLVPGMRPVLQEDDR